MFQLKVPSRNHFGGRGMNSPGSRLGKLAGFCEQGNEQTGSLN
jgi:hypothetical protein